MDKETKELLKRTLTMTDDKLLLKFAKSYANKDQAFAEAIIEKFLPVENAVDYEKMVCDCFLHRKKGGARRYGSSLDWTTIRKDIKRVLKQLDYLRQQQDGRTAAEGALLLLEKLAEEFEDDCVYEDYNYQNSRYGNEEALAIVNDVLQNDKYVMRDHKLSMVKRLQRLAKCSVYRTYLPCGIKDIIDDAHKHLLSPDELLKMIDKNIVEATYDTDKTYYVKWKINLLHELCRYNEAANTINAYLDLDEISSLKYEQLIAANDYEKAKVLCRERLAANNPRQNDRKEWQKRLLELCQETNDNDGIFEACRQLFLNQDIRNEDRMDFFRMCRSILPKQEWPACRAKILEQLKKGTRRDNGFMLEIYKEEGLKDDIFNLLNSLSTFSDWTYVGQHNSAGEKLERFAKYADQLTDLQQYVVEQSIVDTIVQAARYANTRERYAEVAEALRLLSLSCDQGRKDARSIAAKILRNNPQKPAYREEIERYEY